MVLFIVGPPGSGKSEAYRNILDYLQEQRIERINDYAILMRMCDEDVKGERFRATTQYKGFFVTDKTAFNDALQEANRHILNYAMQHKQDDLLLIVEFSRNDYHLAFQQFDKDIVANALILFITAETEESHKRLEIRVTDPPTEDNHYVPPEILTDYYDITEPYAPRNLSADFNIPLDQIEEIDNNGTRDEFRERIERFIDAKIKQKAHL